MSDLGMALWEVWTLVVVSLATGTVMYALIRWITERNDQ